MSCKPRACLVILNDEHEILLIKRQNKGRVYWVFPGGSIEIGETPEIAAIREAFEELSLDVKIECKLFEQMNGNRAESYYLVKSYIGNMKLGKGPEQERQRIDNIYDPLWVNIREIENINLLPLNGKDKVIELVACENL